MDIEQINSEKQSLTLSDEAQSYLLNSAKWTKFLSILGLFITGIIVITELFAGSIMRRISKFTDFGGMPGIIMSFIYLLIGALYIYPLLANLKFANYSILAITQSKTEHLTEAFRNLQGMYKFVGILTIIGLAIYAIIFIFMLVGLAFLR